MFAAINWMATALFDRKYTDFLGVGDRETVLRMTKILKPEIQNDRQVYLSQEMLDIAENIYKSTGCTRTISHAPLAGQAVAAAGSSVQIDEYELPPFGASTLNVEPGRASADILKDVADQFGKGAKHVSVRLDITHPGSIEQCNALRANGFYFCALEPNPSREFLVLQKLSDDLDYGVCPVVKSVIPQESMDLLNKMRAGRSVN
jgi:hypothetical protein